MSSEGDRRAQAARDAAEWLVRLESERMSLEERMDFVRWLRESPMHVAEMLHVCEVKETLGRFRSWSQLTLPETDSRAQLNSVLGGQGLSQSGKLPGRRMRRLSGWCAMAALLAAIAFCVPALWEYLQQSRLSTRMGERREVSLTDGSEVTLAPGSQIRVSMNSSERRVLLDHGEAFFHVSKDPNRPFFVDAGYARTRAVGTAFSVARMTGNVVVTVVEGRVAVSSSRSKQNSSVMDTLGAGVLVGSNEQIAVSDGAAVAPVRKVNGKLETAWVQGQLVFENESVAEVVRRFNSYNHLQIRIADPALGRRPVTAVFRADKPESFVAFLRSVAGVSVQQVAPNEISIESAAAEKPADSTR